MVFCQRRRARRLLGHLPCPLQVGAAKEVAYMDLGPAIRAMYGGSGRDTQKFGDPGLLAHGPAEAFYGT